MRSISVADTYFSILLAGLPKPKPQLSPRELSTIVYLIGQGWTLADALSYTVAVRPTLPFEKGGQ